jgi:hypothetical protein
MPESDSILTAALERMPLAPVPEGFSARVLSQIQASETAARRPAPVSASPKPRFRLHVIDIVAPALIAMTFTATMAFGLLFFVRIDPQTMLELQYQFQVLQWNLLTFRGWPLLFAGFSAGGLAFGVFSLTVLYLQYGRSSRVV